MLTIGPDRAERPYRVLRSTPKNHWGIRVKGRENMSDLSQGPGGWQASDGKWYRAEQHPSYVAPPPPPVPPPPPPPPVLPALGQSGVNDSLGATQAMPQTPVQPTT